MTCHHRHAGDRPRRWTPDTLRCGPTSCRSAGSAEADGKASSWLRPGGGRWGGSRRQPAAGAQLPSLSSEAPASGPSSPSVEQPRTRVTNLPKKTSTCVLFVPYRIPASHSVGPTGGDAVNCYSFTFFSSPSLSVNMSLHSYTPLYLELIFNYLLNQTGKPGRSTWPPWAWLGGRTPSAGRGG